MSESPDDIQCPVCGYYCLGKGGHGCIDKPALCGLARRQASEVLDVAEDGMVVRFNWLLDPDELRQAEDGAAAVLMKALCNLGRPVERFIHIAAKPATPGDPLSQPGYWAVRFGPDKGSR